MTAPPTPNPNTAGGRLDRRQFLALSSAALVGATLVGCNGDGDDDSEGAAGSAALTAATALAAPGAAGLMDEATYQARIDAFLAHATTVDHVDNPVGIATHLIRSAREPDYRWPIEGVTTDSLGDVFAKVDEWQDTRDFDLMYLIWLLELGRGETPTTQLAPTVIEAIEARLVANRYRYDDPLPADRIDNLWYWSENHLIIGHTIELLAGNHLPDATFTVTGMTGAEHAARARPDILAWMRDRIELGFFEWHSNVYMLKNITPLLMLAELSDDPEIVAAAGVGLDLCLLDMAAHNHAGAYTAPRGRTYKKDKMSSLDEATWNTAMFLFDDSAAGFQSLADGGATYLCAAQRYRPPQLVIDIATDDRTSVVRERHGVFFDGSTPISDDVEAPYGRDFEDPANLPFWWSLGALGMWPLARVSVAEADEHRLWDTELFVQVSQMAALNGFDAERIRVWLQPRAAAINFGFLGEANTYAYRTSAVSLATVVDHRPGEMRDQAHAWQAAIDENALVFTNHPVTPPDEDTDWRSDGRPGYWTGEASMPRSAQFERTAVHIYLPKWDETLDPIVWAVLGYQPYTHAYVPQDHFDQVVQDGHWTVGERSGAYIGLWSWRRPTFRVYDPAVLATRDMVEPFDLVAEGGPDNVWIVEVGTREDDGDLDSFVAGLTADEPEVVRDGAGFTVSWASPSAGEIEFSSTGPFVVDGDEQRIADFPRHESPWGTVEHLATAYALDSGSSTWAVNAEGWSRQVS